MRHTYIEKLFAIDLKLKLTWESCSFLCCISLQPAPTRAPQGGGSRRAPAPTSGRLQLLSRLSVYRTPSPTHTAQEDRVQPSSIADGNTEAQKERTTHQTCRREQLAPYSTQIRHSSQRSMQKISSNPFNKSRRNGSWIHFTDKGLKSHR